MSSDRALNVIRVSRCQIAVPWPGALTIGMVRSELTARLFFDQYLPRQLSAVPLGGDGWYLPAR